jgi:hypothetical protein
MDEVRLGAAVLRTVLGLCQEVWAAACEGRVLMAAPDSRRRTVVDNGGLVCFVSRWISMSTWWYIS